MLIAASFMLYLLHFIVYHKTKHLLLGSGGSLHIVARWSFVKNLVFAVVICKESSQVQRNHSIYGAKSILVAPMSSSEMKYVCLKINHTGNVLFLL